MSPGNVFGRISIFRVIIRKSRLAGAAILLLPLFSGCGLTPAQKAAVHQFGTSTTDFVSVTRAEFLQSRQDVIEMNRLRVLLGDDTVRQLDGLFTVDRTLARIRALEALDEYGRLLTQLMGASSSQDLQGSAANLVASFNRIDGIHINDAQAESLGKLIALGGGWIVEQRREKAVEQVVVISHPHVLRLIELVERDFDPQNGAWSAGYHQTRSSLDGAIAELPRNTGVEHPGVQFVRGARLAARENDLRFREMPDRICEAARQLRQVQEKLHTAVTQPEFNFSIADAEVCREKIIELRTTFEMLRQSGGIR